MQSDMSADINKQSTAGSAESVLSVREATPTDLEKTIDYFLQADNSFLQGMGVDTAKLPSKEGWLKLLNDEYQKPYREKKFFYIIWLLDGIPVGHSNVNKIIYGEEAYMHLHLWRSDKRRKGIGLEFLKMSIPYYFDRFRLKNLYCEPYALNPAPNKTLKKLGFEFIRTYETIPGWINFRQPVNRWRLQEENTRIFTGVK